MTFSIEFSEEAASDFGFILRSDRKLAKRILAKIESLITSPYDGKPLVGNHRGEFSLRVGSYRVVYELHKTGHVVYILTIKHRKHVY
jgi:mRNA interferase RelE/StbE